MLIKLIICKILFKHEYKKIGKISDNYGTRERCRCENCGAVKTKEIKNTVN